MHRKHQNWKLRKFRADVLDELNAVGARQAKIDNSQIGTEFSNHVHRFGSIASFAADREASVGMNQLLEPFPK